MDMEQAPPDIAPQALILPTHVAAVAMCTAESVRHIDVRHIVCGQASGFGANADYRTARQRVKKEIAAGQRARIILLAERSYDVRKLRLDVPIDIIPIFPHHGAGDAADALETYLSSLILSSARAGTSFRIYGNRHPILVPIRENIRAQGFPVSVYGSRPRRASGE